MTKTLLILAALPVCAGPILHVPVNFELHMPGVIPNLTDLYTFIPRGSVPPPFDTCGQIGFIPTLEDGTPDPSGIIGYIQINTSCAGPVGESLTALDTRPDPTSPDLPHVPEPATWLLVLSGLAIAGIVSVGGKKTRLVWTRSAQRRAAARSTRATGQRSTGSNEAVQN